MDVYVVYTDRWIGPFPDTYIDGVFKSKESAWKCIESKYDRFIKTILVLVKIIDIRIDNNSVVIHFEDDTGRHSIAYRIAQHKLK